MSCSRSSSSPRESWAVKGPAPRVAPEDLCFKRTRIIGFSQVGAPKGGWFVQAGVFESIAGDDHWELQWMPGGGIDQWRDPDYKGWSAPLVSPCPGDLPVDRVVLVIGSFVDDSVGQFVRDIDATIGVIRQKIPTAHEIVLHPVVGGPAGERCKLSDGETIGAGSHYPMMVEAIREVVARQKDPGVRIVAGYTARINSCGDYADKIGHLRPVAAERIGRQIAEDYVRRDAACVEERIRARAQGRADAHVKTHE